MDKIKTPQEISKSIKDKQYINQSIVNLAHAGVSCFTGLRNERLIHSIQKGPDTYSRYLKNSMGKYLALQGGAAIASVVFQILHYIIVI